MTTKEKLVKLEELNLAPFGLVAKTSHPNGWGARCVLQLQYASQLSSSEAGLFDALVADATEYAWRATQDAGAITAPITLAVEEMLAPLAEKAKAYTLLCVGHAHIDMNWMWGYDETVSITLDTFRTVLELMKEYKDFTFGQSQASVYRIVEMFDPAMLEEIRERVREKRWEVTASTWVEADRNMPNLESMARHLLYTRQYLTTLLDLPANTLGIDYEPDTFGHSLHVPEVLADGGVKYYYHCRGYDGHVLYNWKAPSGRSLLVFREPSWYNWTMDGRCALLVPEFCKNNGMDVMLRVYGVGDHGGGPTRRDLERIQEMNTWPIFPTYRFGTYHEFFHQAEKVRGNLPTVSDELNIVFDGCYTTQSRQKAGNRKAEALLAETEGLVALTGSYGSRAYPREAFAEAWKKVLFNQFHDILPGSGTVDTREYAMGQYQEVFATVNVHRANGLRDLAHAVDTQLFLQVEDIAQSRSEGAGVGFGLSEGMVAQTAMHAGLQRLFLVYNPVPEQRSQAVALTVWDWNGDVRRMQWADAQGNPLEYQVKDAGFNDYWGHHYTKVLVMVPVPSCGYTTIVLTQSGEPVLGPVLSDPRVDLVVAPVLENEWLRVVLDERSGAMLSFVDKQTGMEFVRPGQESGVFRLVQEDTQRGMSAWRVGRYKNVKVLNEGVRFKRMETGKNLLRQEICYDVSFGNGSHLEAILSLDKGERMLRMETNVRWQEIGDATVSYPQLQFLVPVGYPFEKVRYDVPMGTIDREKRSLDVPAQSFGMPVHRNGFSLMLLNDTKYGYRATEEGLSLTLLRSSTDPDPWPEIGQHRIQMALAPVQDDPCRNLATAASFRSPLSAVPMKAGPGKLPLHASFLTMEAEGLLLTGVKEAEDSQGLILRLHETNGTHAKGRVTFLRQPAEAHSVDLQEQAVGTDVHVEGMSVLFDCPPHGVRSLRIRFQE